MKCLFKDGKYEKVSNDLEAEKKVKNYGYKYVPKSEWKQNVRDVKKVILEVIKTPEELTKHQKTKERRAKNHSKLKQ